jgi:hypothetical protein
MKNNQLCLNRIVSLTSVYGYLVTNAYPVGKVPICTIQRLNASTKSGIEYYNFDINSYNIQLIYFKIELYNLSTKYYEILSLLYILKCEILTLKMLINNLDMVNLLLAQQDYELLLNTYKEYIENE